MQSLAISYFLATGHKAWNSNFIIEMTATYSPEGRICRINPATQYPGQSGGVLYVMSRDQRTQDNPALHYAQQIALNASLPLYVLFVLYDKPVRYRAVEQLTFMLRGLEDVSVSLQKRNITFIMRIGSPASEILAVAQELMAAAIVLDASPLNGPRFIAEAVGQDAACPVYVVDAHNIVPLAVASAKQEYSARTLRPKIHRQLARWLADETDIIVHPFAPKKQITSIGTEAAVNFCESIYGQNHTDISRFVTGETAARRAMTDFIRNKLIAYAASRNDPTKNGLSELSPYLHFGQLSTKAVVRAALEGAARDTSAAESADALIEEIVIRKELSDNFCYYNAQHDSLRGGPDWALNTLESHRLDPRSYIYSDQAFEHAQTHDIAWNAAQKQLTRTGKMHGYMRMYWAKKILEWSESPVAAHATALSLNDFYSIDGGDPNGYVGILWAIAGLHDRPWGERPVYGTVRSMVYDGLRRKFPIDNYIQKYL